MSGSRRNTSMLRGNSCDEEINVRVEVINTLELKIKKSYEIKSIKALIQETGVAQDKQEIFFDGTQLKDKQRLDHYSIGDFSTLQLFVPGPEMSLYVKLPDGKIFVCIAGCSDTVKKVKDTIQAWQDIQSESFMLVCNGTVLEDQWTLVAANVKEHSLLNLVFCPEDTLAVSLLVPSGDVLKLNVKPLFTIADVKGILGGMTDIPINKQNLFIGGKHLEDCKTLAFYDVKEDTVLELISSFRIYILQNQRETFTINVTKYSTAGDVIDDLKDPHICKQHLYHGGIQLEESRNLVSYEIREDSLLELVPSYQIFVKAFYGGTVTVEMDKYDTLKDVKRKMFTKLNLPVDRQVIFFKGKILEEEGHLLENGIEKHSTLGLELIAVS